MQIAIIILLALLSVVLAVRIYRLERGVRSSLALLRGEMKQEPELSLQRRLSSVGNMLRLTAETVRTAGEEAQVRRFLQQLLDRLDDAFLVLDPDLKIRFANREARELFSVDEPIGRQLIEVCVDHRIVAAVEQVFRERALATAEVVLPPAESSAEQVDQTFALKAAPVDDDASLGVWLLLRNRTLQRETEQIRRDFVANAAHELKTPLSVIRGYLEMLGEFGQLPDAARRPVEKMLRHSERLSRLVEDMLTISSLENDPTLRTENFPLGDCARDAVDYLKPLIEEQEAKVEFDFADPSATLDGDRFYWEQVFLNLLENALKHNRSKPGLKLTIRHRAGENGGHRIEVRDNGIGIPKGDLGHIFERFYRVEKHHSQATPGTGLGLSIVKRAVAAHGGEIRVESTPGRSTTFVITLGNDH